MTTKSHAYGSGRERIMQAATDVVLNEGLRGLTFRAVAEQAGVANSLIVHHFGTRQKLLEETLDWTLSESIGLTQLPTFLNNPEAYVSALFDLLTADMSLIVFQYQMILESRRKSVIQEPVRLLYKKYIDELVGAIQMTTSTKIDEDSGRYVFATLDGLVLQYVAGVDRDSIERALLRFWKNEFDKSETAEGKVSVLFLQYPDLLGKRD
mgnify:CR=1 FL=1